MHEGILSKQTRSWWECLDVGTVVLIGGCDLETSEDRGSDPVEGKKSNMIVGVVKETFPGERRVALTPDVVPTLAKAKMEVWVEAGAGQEAGFISSGIFCRS